MFKNQKIGKKLIILATVMLLALLINGALGFIGIQKASNEINKIYFGGVNELNLLNSLKTLYTLRISENIHKLKEGLITWQESQNNFQQIQLEGTKVWKDFLFEDDNFTEKDLAKNNLVENIIQHVKGTSSELKTISAIIAKENQEELNEFISRSLEPSIQTIENDFNRLEEWIIEDSRKDYTVATKTINEFNLLMIFMFLIAVASSLFLAIQITKSITTPLNQAVKIINRLALGDTTLKIEYNSQDEIGELFNAMRSMVESSKKAAESIEKFSTGDLNINLETRSENDIVTLALNDMIRSSRKMSEILNTIANGDLTISLQPRSEKDQVGIAFVNMTNKLREIIGEIQNEVSTLTSSSEEIVASISQVSAGSAETASAVTETTTTVEELKQTAHVSADKAKDVLTNAEETLQVVKMSEKSLKATIEDMNHINDKMRIISEGIVKLSEHTQAIGEIIESVNDLAEQSNLLAVNAAIEAAKAGEQGKSFGVVAQEIRTLAEQSKAATVQVRAILNDIQNSTSAAVLATEQGSRAVEKGVNQSIQTNESMHVLSKSINRVAQHAQQISLSSQQQLVGVDQVTIAMNNIKEAASQHAEQMKQIETAIVSLNDIGNTFKEITGQYTLDKNQGNFGKFSFISKNLVANKMQDEEKKGPNELQKKLKALLKK